MKDISPSRYDRIAPNDLDAFIAARRKTLATDELFGLPLVNAVRADAAEEIVRAAHTGMKKVVNFVNAHCVNVAGQDADYSHALGRSDLLLPDGSGMRIAAKLAGVAMGENLNGTDLFPEICERAADRGLPIFLLGGTYGVSGEAGRTMRALFPALQVAGSMHGYFDSKDEELVIARINASGAKILFVGFGVPLQEKWIERNRHRLDVPVILGVGGLFDYYSGRIPRAPQAIRNVGCEWAWRLAQEPRRMAKRYLYGNAAFLVRALHHAVDVRGIASAVSDGLKRSLDLVVTLVALTFLMPIFLAVAAAIKWEDGGPVFFKQTRVGMEGRNFKMLKFRSMYIDAEARRAALLAHSERDGTCFKMREDPRITRTGRFIRRFSLDELPQLFNVISGEMSLVGPRPALPVEAESYSGNCWDRLKGKPGLTCIWQVSGRADIPFEKQVEMDRDYLSMRSLMVDFGLLFKTVPAVLSGRGAY